MPQLMPLFWLGSLFMVSLILLTLIIFFYNKDFESFRSNFLGDNNFVKYNYLW